MKKLQAGGGVLYRPGDDDRVLVLLIYRRGVWDLPKGKKERDESIAECARREVSEEVGGPLPEIIDKIGETYHEYHRDGDRIGKTTHWYAMQMEWPDSFSPQGEEDIEEVAWVPLGKARARMGYENLSTLLEQFERWLDRNNKKRDES